MYHFFFKLLRGPKIVPISLTHSKHLAARAEINITRNKFLVKYTTSSTIITPFS